jgi:hypothetical protein
MLVKQIIMCNQFTFSISFYNRKINQINRFASYIVVYIDTFYRTWFSNQYDKQWMFILAAGCCNDSQDCLATHTCRSPVASIGRSIHSKWAGCSFSLLRLIVCCRNKRATAFAEWVDEIAKVAKPWFRFCVLLTMFPNVQPSPHQIDCLQSVNNGRRVSSWTNNCYKGIVLVVLTMPPDSQQIPCSTDWLSVDKEQSLQSKFMINN